ncbi:MAG: glycosyltransferase family 2 protein, partial [Acidimicrobiales bacterium]
LAAQSFEDFEVLLLVHGDDPGVLANCRDLVGRFDEGFSSRVRVVPVPGGGGRTAPLNRGLELAEGRYVAFLDDDDLVTADWAGAFAEGIERAPGKVVRSGCLARHVRRAGSGEAAMGGVPVTLTRPLPEFAGRFDVLAHLAVNQTTNLSVAIPHALVTELELRFNERNEVCEDWELLVRAALVVGVEDTGRLTGIYQRWDDGGSSTASSAPGAWTETPRRMRADLDSRPLLLPPGSASKIGHLVRDPELGRKRLLEVELVEAIAAIKSARAEAVAAETRAASAEERTAAAESHAATTEARAVAAEERTAAAECRAATAETRAASAEERTAAAERAHNEIAQSEFWRLTAPIRLPLSRLAARRRPRP